MTIICVVKPGILPLIPFLAVPVPEVNLPVFKLHLPEELDAKKLREIHNQSGPYH